MKLELKHLAPYQEHKVKLMFKGEKYNIGYLSTKRIAFINQTNELIKMTWEQASIKVKPILRPLSDLTKEIEVNGEKFIPIRKILKEVGINYPLECYNQDEQWILNDGYRAIGEFPHRKVNQLIEWHFDVFRLIPEKLAIDINTLK
jgi:hypothetical protein